MVLRFLLAGVAAAALGPLAAPAAAVLTPTLDPLAPCYVAAQPDQRERVDVNAHGFTPYAYVDVYVDDVLQPVPPGSAPPQADVNGDVRGSVSAPFIPLGVHRFTLRLTQQDAPDNTVTATSKVAALTVEQRPARASTRSRVRFSGRGFTTPGTVYAHYLFAGHSHKTVRISRTHGACGQFSRRMRQFPFRHSPKVGTWTIQFDQTRHYDPAQENVAVRLTIKVHRTIKPRR